MKVFNPINRDFIAPVDLNVLQNTYNTLEQGHLKAVSTASAIKSEIGKLDLNEAESDYKQQLVNQIQTTINDNLVEDNAYGALDDLILQQGDIFSNQGLLGRLQAQKDYKAYQDSIDKAKIPEEYKNYYRTHNKYYYNPKFDDNGNELQGDTWKPQEQFVDSINPNEVMSKALKDVMKTAGASEIANENGQWLVKRGSRWEGLDSTKVETAIRNALATTPGMKASLYQDWNIGVRDKYFSLLKENGDEPFIDERFTDDKGNLINEDNYVNNMINDFVYTSSGINYINTVDYQHIPQYSGSGSSASSAGVSGEDIMRARDMAQSSAQNVGNYVLQTNTYNNAVKQSNSAGSNFSNLISKNNTIMAKNGGTITPGSIIKYVKANNGGANVTGPGDALNQYFKMINPNTGKPYGDSYTDAERQLIYLASDAYTRSILDQKELETHLSTTNREAFKFKQSLDKGSFDANNSIYDKQVIGYNNQLFNEGNLTFDMPNEVYDSFVRMYNGTLPDYIKTQKGADGRTSITLLESARNSSPEFAYNLIEANNSTTSMWNPANIISAGLNHRKRLRFDYQGTGNANNKHQAIVDLANIYKKGQIRADKAIKEFNEPVSEVIDVSATMYPTETAAINQYLLSYGNIDRETANWLNKQALDNLKGALANGNIAQGNLFEVKDYEEGKPAMYTESDDPYKLQALISYMYANNKPVKQVYGPFQGVINDNNVSPSGYYLTFTVPDDYHEKKYRNKTMKVFIGGTSNEGTGYDIGSTTTMQAENAARIAKTTGKDYSIIPYNSNLLDTHVRRIDGDSYELNLLGQTRIGTFENVVDYNNCLITLKQAKQQFLSGKGLDIVESNLERHGVYNFLSYIYGDNANYSDLIKNQVRKYLYDTTVE